MLNLNCMNWTNKSQISSNAKKKSVGPFIFTSLYGRVDDIFSSAKNILNSSQTKEATCIFKIFCAQKELDDEIANVVQSLEEIGEN